MDDIEIGTGDDRFAEELRAEGTRNPLPVGRAVVLYARVLFESRTAGRRLTEAELDAAAAVAVRQAREIVASRLTSPQGRAGQRD